MWGTMNPRKTSLKNLNKFISQPLDVSKILLNLWQTVELLIRYCISLAADLVLHCFFKAIPILRVNIVFVFGLFCVEVLWPSQPNGVMSSAVSLPNHTFTGQA